MRIGSHPDLNLSEPGLQMTFQADEKLAVLWVIRHIHEDPDQVVAEFDSLVLPNAVDDLRLPRNRPETLFQLNERFADQTPRHSLAVIEPERQQDFVATRVAH